MPATLTGPQAEVRWGYHIAAALGPWQYTGSTGTPDDPRPIVREFTAVVRSLNAMALRQRPLTVILPMPRGPWRFPVLTLTLVEDNTRLVARLGEKEASHVTLRST